MMEAPEIIEKINSAVTIENLLDPKNFKSEFKDLIKKIHPDVCKDPRANDAVSKLNALKDKYENGTTYTDESGSFKSTGYLAVFNGNESLLRESYTNWISLKSLRDPASQNFQKYIPANMSYVSGGANSGLNVVFSERAVPLSGLTLPQKHVNWILSRMLEYCAWMQQQSKVHCGLNPDSVFVLPGSHGIQVATFYMLSKEGSKANGVSGKYQSWYPPELFDTKIATYKVDLELCMKTAIYLLGDKSGVGIKLRKDPNVNQEFLDFVITQHTDPASTWKEYRELLNKNFKKEFHILNV